MTLRFEPLGIFQSSRTPAGLYARRKWLGHGNTRGWRQDFRETVRDLLVGQGEDGSWGGSPLLTIHRLFGLHLTLRDRTEPIGKALHWLLERCRVKFPLSRAGAPTQLVSADLEDLPFSVGCSGLFLYGATLFLCSIFGMDRDENVLSFYQSLERLAVANKGRWCGWSCSNNILRAFVVHPEFSLGEGTRLAVRALSGVQRRSGVWVEGVPFCQTVNALAHLDVPEANRQLDAAFRRLHQTQNRDGTWGRAQKEWKTFLAVHALKRKGVMTVSR